MRNTTITENNDSILVLQANIKLTCSYQETNYKQRLNLTRNKFTSEHKAEVLPQTLVCLKTLCNAAMKPSFLKRHLERNHPNKINAEEIYFQQLADNIKRKRMDKTG